MQNALSPRPEKNFTVRGRPPPLTPGRLTGGRTSTAVGSRPASAGVGGPRGEGRGAPSTTLLARWPCTARAPDGSLSFERFWFIRPRTCPP